MHTMIDNLPLFSQINPNEIESQLDKLLEKSRHDIDRLTCIDHPTWKNFAKPIQTIYSDINDFFSPGTGDSRHDGSPGTEDIREKSVNRGN